jgi:hypothetical protein
LSKRAYDLCREEDASGLRAFLEEHPDVDVYEHIGDGQTVGPGPGGGDLTWHCSIVGVAAQYKSTQCLQVLLDFGVDVNKPGRHHGYTPLMYSSGADTLACMRLLLENNADVNHKSTSGLTGLLVACRDGHVECVRLLINSKADVQVRVCMYVCVRKCACVCICVHVRICVYWRA